MNTKMKQFSGYTPLRNHDAMNPLMRKGGPHGKTRKAQRKDSRQRLVRELRSAQDGG